MSQATDEKVALLLKAMSEMQQVCVHQTGRDPKRITKHRMMDIAELRSIPARGHPLTCGNDSTHTLLFPIYDVAEQKVKLVCADCDYTQVHNPLTRLGSCIIQEPED